MAKNVLSPEELSSFHHSYKSRVQFYEVDSFNVVHNVRFHYWFEWARLLYMEELGIQLKSSTIVRDFPLMTVRSEIDYFAPGRLGMEYEILTKISVVKNSSLQFEHIALNNEGVILSKCSGWLVHVDPKGKETKRIPDEMRENIRIAEKNNVQFLD